MAVVAGPVEWVHNTLHRDVSRMKRNHADTWWEKIPVRPQRPRGTHAYDPFFIPHHVLSSPTRHQTGRLLQLPMEIILMIIERINVPWIQVVFTLTCKQVASLVSKHISLLAPWRGFQDKENLLRVLSKQGRYSSPYGIERLDPWMPINLRLCRACFRFVPSSRDYWNAKFEQWGVLKSYPGPTCALPNDMNLFFNHNRGDGQNKCPECLLRNNETFMRENAYRKAQYWNTCYGDRGYDTVVKPDLKARIERP